MMALSARAFMVRSGHRLHRRLIGAAAATQSGSEERLYVTTPIYYVNAAPHIGHAYTSIACDAACRFAKLDGMMAKLATGTDEHGQKVEESAEASGEEPLEFATRVSATFRELAERYEVNFDRFIRTTEADHAKAVEILWRTLVAKDKIYLGAYEGWYCVRDECYYTESELVDGKAPTGAEVEWRAKEPSYFFKLSDYQQTLLEMYEKDEIQLMPASRKNEVVAFLKDNELRDLSISRTTFDWGIRVPDDPEHVVYVWIDALTNYLTAIGYPEDTSDWREWWTSSTHVVGKDILRFHAVYWPALLVAAGLPPPKKIIAHGWWTKDGNKISKSLGNVVDPYELLDTYGVDAVRYFMLAEVPFGNDGDFNNRAVLAAANGFLANAVGNLAQRVCTMLFNTEAAATPPLDLDPDAAQLIQEARSLADAMRPHMHNFRFDLALAKVEHVVRETNRYFDAKAPWKLKKSDPEAMLRVLAASLEAVRCIAIAYQPFMPVAAAKLLELITVPPEQRLFRHLASGVVQPGTPLSKPVPIFPRIEDPAEVRQPQEEQRHRRSAKPPRPAPKTRVSSQKTPLPPAPSPPTDSLSSSSAPQPADTAAAATTVLKAPPPPLAAVSSSPD